MIELVPRGLGTTICVHLNDPDIPLPTTNSTCHVTELNHRNAQTWRKRKVWIVAELNNWVPNYIAEGKD